VFYDILAGKAQSKETKRTTKSLSPTVLCTSAPVYGETVETRGQSVLNEMDVPTAAAAAAAAAVFCPTGSWLNPQTPLTPWIVSDAAS